MVDKRIPRGNLSNPVLKVKRNIAKFPIKPILKKAESKRSVNSFFKK